VFLATDDVADDVFLGQRCLELIGNLLDHLPLVALAAT